MTSTLMGLHRKGREFKRMPYNQNEFEDEKSYELYLRMLRGRLAEAIRS